MTSAGDAGRPGQAGGPVGGPAAPGDLLGGRYRLEEVLGRGGMGVTWAARDETLGREVAVKQVVPPAELPEPERALLRARTLREARAAARISSRAAVTVFDVVEQDGRPWLVMERLPPVTLADAVAGQGRLSPGQAARVGLDVLDALAAAQEVGVLHRDVKPSNVMLRDGRAVLTDFGIATIEDDPALTTTGMIVGSPAYLAPERARGEPATLAGDLWSLGATLYAAVEGGSPFQRPGGLATLNAVVTEPLPPPRHAGLLGPVIKQLLEKDPARRPTLTRTRQLLEHVVAASGAEQLPTEVLAVADTRPVPGPRTGSTAVFAPLAAPASPAPAPAAPAPAAPAPPAPVAPAPNPYAHVPTAPPPAKGLATGKGKGKEKGDGGRPRRPSTRAAVALAVTLLAAYLLARGGTGAGSSADGSGGPASGSPRSAATGSAPATGPTGGGTPSTTGGAASAGAGTGDATASGPGGSPGGAAASGSTGAVPDGFRLVSDPTGYRIAVPEGWRRSTEGSRTYYRDPQDGRFLMIDQTDQPQADPLQDWKDQEPAVAERLPGYRRVAIQRVDYRGWDAADWEFTWRPDGGPLHVLSRNVRVSDRQAYALYWSTPEDGWSAGRDWFRTFADTFQPAG